MPRRKATLIFALFALLFWAAPEAHAQALSVAKVKTLEGSATLLRDGESRSLSVGDDLFVADVLKTSDNSSLGLSFSDSSIISLGSNSEMEISAFEFIPSEDKLSFFSRLLRGTLLYVSGIIAKLSPEDVKVETPVATVTVRGTRMLIRAE